MGSKAGALVIRFAGDLRDFAKATGKVSTQLEGVAKVAGAAGIAAGAALAAGVVGSMNVEKANDKLAAQMGLSKKRSAQIGKVAGNLYKNAYGDSIEGVNEAVGAVMTSIDGMSKASGKKLEDVTGKAMNFAQAFEVDVSRGAQIAGQVVRTGLAKNATEAFDLMTSASQKVPVALREDVLDAADEYGQFFAGIGMNGKQTFAALVKGAEKGQFGIDKIGDAVKEFTIRSTDMSTSSKDAYKAIGLDAGSMANKMTKGGKQAGKATQDIVKGLLDMKPGAKQANAAIALFGTPLEDLSVQEIPAFLKQLQGSGKAMDGFKGSTERMGKTLNDNAATNLESFKRQVSSTFVEFVGGKALPAVNKVASALATGFGPALKSVAGFLGRNKDIVIPLAVALGTFVGIIAAIVGAMKVWAAVQAALNFVMSLNPIGLVIIAVAALVAGLVYFFTKTKLGQKIIKNVWSGIKSAIAGVAEWWTKTAWPAIRGALSAMGSWFKMVGRVAGRAWRGIKSAISSVAKWWTETAWPAIRGVLSAMGNWFKMVGRVASRAWRGLGDALGATWRWIKKNVIDNFVRGVKIWVLIFKISVLRVRKAFGAVGDALGRVWRWIKKHVIDSFIRGFRNAGNLVKSVGHAIASHFRKMRDRLGSVANWIRKHVFGKVVDALGSMKRGFQRAKDGIGRIWEGLKKVAARPIRFLVNTVWNNGLRKMINAIPGVPNINPTKLKFANGGGVNGPGTGTSDSIMARLSKGEHVWTAREVKAAGGQKQMYRMREAVLKGNLNGDPKFANGGALSSAQISRGQTFARRQMGKPYIWGGTGPTGFDCSGFISAITQAIRGGNTTSRLGATSSFPWSGFKRGPGQFTVGSTPNYGGSGIGHMVGNIGGMGVESRGGSGVILGPGAMNPAGGAFTQYHLGKAGAVGSGGGMDWLDTIKTMMKTIKGLPGQLSEMMAKGGWIVGLLKKAMRSTWSDLAGYLNKKIPNFGPIPDNPIPRKFATGGMVRARAGGVHAILGEAGYDEMVVPMGGPNAPGRRGGSRPETVYVDLGPEIMRLIRRQVKSGGGNVQLVLGRG